MKENPKESTINKLISEINKLNGLEKIRLEDLLKPNGYADKIVKEAGLTRVQLRKIFAEFKTIENYFKSDPEKSKYHLYKLYPIIQYQVNRKLISEDFKRLIFAILNSLESNFSLENFKRTIDFMEALVAYTPRD